MGHINYQDRNSNSTIAASTSFNRRNPFQKIFCCFFGARQVREQNDLCSQTSNNNHLEPKKDTPTLANRRIKQHIDLPKDSEEQKKLLHRAIRLGDIHTISFLKEQGIYFHSKDKDNNTPLHVAIMMSDNETMLRYLLLNCYTVMDLLLDRNDDGFSPLELAIVQNNKVAVKICFEKYTVDMNRIFCAEQSLIELAYKNKSMDVIDILENALRSKNNSKPLETDINRN